MGNQTGGTKYDQDKPRMDLIDAEAMEELAKVLGFGAQKYGEDNWRKGIKIRRLLGAAFRHGFALLKGEDLDEETGLSHAAHAMCCFMFIFWTLKHRKDMDDRWSGFKDFEPANLVEIKVGTKVFLCADGPDSREWEIVRIMTDGFQARQPETGVTLYINMADISNVVVIE